jgi:hypothetical protein
LGLSSAIKTAKIARASSLHSFLTSISLSSWAIPNITQPTAGFVPASRFGILCEYDGVPDEAFMILVLKDDALAGFSVLGDIGMNLPKSPDRSDSFLKSTNSN